MAIFNPVTKGKIFVILPALNEEEALRRLLPDIHHATDMMRTAIHVIVIDDGSTDRTADAAQWAPEGLSVEVIRHGENRGLAGGLTTGISRVLELSEGEHDLMVCMDADHTHPPESIPKMAALIWEGEDIVIASRYQPGSRQRGVPRFRRFLSWGAKTLFRLLLPIPGVRDYTCGYRAYRVSTLREAWSRTDGHLITTRGFACTDELLIKLALITDQIREIPFTLRYDRKPGKSKLQLGVTIRAQLRVLKHLRRLRRAGLPD